MVRIVAVMIMMVLMMSMIAMIARHGSEAWDLTPANLKMTAPGPGPWPWGAPANTCR